MLKTLKILGTVLGVLLCAALGGAAGWYGRGVAAGGEDANPVVEKVFAAPINLPAEDEGIVTFLSGEGFRKRGTVWEPLEPGSLVGVRDVIRMAEGGAADVQFGDLAVVRLRQNSSIVVDDIATGRNGRLALSLMSGTVLFKVNRNTGKVTLKTPDGNLSVMGTEFLVTTGGDGTFASVRDGSVAVEGASELGAGFGMRLGSGASAAPRALSPAGQADLAELGGMRLLDISGVSGEGGPRAARVLVEAVPSDSMIFLEGDALGRGRAALVVPFGRSLNVSAAKAGYRTASLRIPVEPGEAERRYVLRLEPDPEGAGSSMEAGGLEKVISLENRVAALEDEIKTRELLYRTVTAQSSSLGTERELLMKDAERARKETDSARVETEKARKETAAVRAEVNAARGQTEALEKQISGLKTALEQEKERVRQIMELLKE
ncbi:MAG: FecR domain-containing protein [Spirochaetales bacterium]|jgi:hypothetical protein|nr:FecR domain-containing protein [Spirochaetales bacterium]